MAMCTWNVWVHTYRNAAGVCKLACIADQVVQHLDNAIGIAAYMWKFGRDVAFKSDTTAWQRNTYFCDVIRGSLNPPCWVYILSEHVKPQPQQHHTTQQT
eukprot:364818-Chlamydomonas_euryale.AAC.36